MRIENVFDEDTSRLNVTVKLLDKDTSTVGSRVTVLLVVQVIEISLVVVMEGVVVVENVEVFEGTRVAVGNVTDRVIVATELDERDIEEVLPETLFS